MDATPDTTRQPHAVLDLPSRRQKGLKIERLLGLQDDPDPIRLLEIGTGSGGIAHYFATHQEKTYDVSAVDVIDNRLIHTGFDFTLVEGTTLPFPDASFDVFLTNHVIEHVGERPAQLAHLLEVRRVMAPRAVGYLAVPNRWMLVEPHFRLAFLSWLPLSLRSPYLRLMRKGDVYDCKPLRLPELNALLSEAGFRFQHLEIEALREFVAIEGARTTSARLANAIPESLLNALRPLIPTLICRLER